MSRTLPLFRWLVSITVLAATLLLCAGRTGAPMFKAYLSVLAGMSLVTALIANPPQDGERRKPGPAAIDPGSRCLASVLFLSTMVIAALGTGRFHWIRGTGWTTQRVALVVLILAAGLQAWAMVLNPFFSSAIRIQTDRGYDLVTRGPYQHVRHPGYLAMIIVMPATALALGSVATMIPASCYSALILWRTTREDEFLTKRLAGYAEYATRVRYRLIPGLW